MNVNSYFAYSIMIMCVNIIVVSHKSILGVNLSVPAYLLQYCIKYGYCLKDHSTEYPHLELIFTD